MNWKKISYAKEAARYPLPAEVVGQDRRDLLAATEAHREWLKHQAYADIAAKAMHQAVSALSDNVKTHYLSVTEDLGERHEQFQQYLDSDTAKPSTLKATYNKLMSYKPIKD